MDKKKLKDWGPGIFTAPLCTWRRAIPEEESSRKLVFSGLAGKIRGETL